MPFALPDRWVWDAWYVEHEGKTHMFFLNAPKSIGNPEHRHFYASVGHATSSDLVNWTEHKQVLTASVSPAWDDLAIWTGCVIRRPDGRWMLFYTGISRAERGHVQRIGAALSDDLNDWSRIDKPLVTVNSGHYQTIDHPACADEACRDPIVFPDPDGNGWHMYFTASGLNNIVNENGVIGHAWSADLDNWIVKPPIWQGDLCAQLEVPDLSEIDGRWYLLFNTQLADLSNAWIGRQRQPLVTGTYYLVSDDGPLGPWTHIDDQCLMGDADESYYVARRTRDINHTPTLIAFNNYDSSGRFVGTLTNPVCFNALPDGKLRVSKQMDGLTKRLEEIY